MFTLLRNLAAGRRVATEEVQEIEYFSNSRREPGEVKIYYNYDSFIPPDSRIYLTEVARFDSISGALYALDLDINQLRGFHAYIIDEADENVLSNQVRRLHSSLPREQRNYHKFYLTDSQLKDDGLIALLTEAWLKHHSPTDKILLSFSLNHEYFAIVLGREKKKSDLIYTLKNKFQESLLPPGTFFEYQSVADDVALITDFKLIFFVNCQRVDGYYGEAYTVFMGPSRQIPPNEPEREPDFFKQGPNKSLTWSARFYHEPRIEVQSFKEYPKNDGQNGANAFQQVDYKLPELADAPPKGPASSLVPPPGTNSRPPGTPSSATGDVFQPPPSSATGDGFQPPPSSATGDGIQPPPSSATGDGFQPPPSSATGDGFQPPPSSATGDVFQSPPSSATGDVFQPPPSSAGNDSIGSLSDFSEELTSDGNNFNIPPELLLTWAIIREQKNLGDLTTEILNNAKNILIGVIKGNNVDSDKTIISKANEIVDNFIKAKASNVEPPLIVLEDNWITIPLNIQSVLDKELKNNKIQFSKMIENYINAYHQNKSNKAEGGSSAGAFVAVSAMVLATLISALLGAQN
jgi:hypothetical protein